MILSIQISMSVCWIKTIVTVMLTASTLTEGLDATAERATLEVAQLVKVSHRTRKHLK